MNHRLKFRYNPDVYGALELQEVWCPGDHGGECDKPEVDPDDHTEDCDRMIPANETIGGKHGWADCTCGGSATGNCWAKENLDLFVAESDGWQECLKGSIDLPWVAVTIDGPGPDGNDELTVTVIAETTEQGETE